MKWGSLALALGITLLIAGCSGGGSDNSSTSQSSSASSGTRGNAWWNATWNAEWNDASGSDAAVDGYGVDLIKFRTIFRIHQTSEHHSSFSSGGSIQLQLGQIHKDRMASTIPSAETVAAS
jgi:hypothetical protein